jgi:beta-1,4-N-acetylglucosaminyltransferase
VLVRKYMEIRKMSQPPAKKSERIVFVTVGTTLFEALIDAMTQKSVLERLAKLGYTLMIVQYGKGAVPKLGPDEKLPLRVQVYDFQTTLAADMQRADLIIGHAGAGTVSEVLGYGKRLVVVINTALMHNHQTELGHAMRDRHHLYVVEEPQRLLQDSTWEAIEQFKAVPLPAGDPYDFPNLLDRFLAT